MELDLDKISKDLATARENTVSLPMRVNRVLSTIPLLIARIEELEAKQRELVDDLDKADYGGREV